MKIQSAPIPLIIAIEIPISSSFELMIFEVPAIAEEPHIAFPTPNKSDRSFEIPNILPINKQKSIDIIIIIMINKIL